MQYFRGRIAHCLPSKDHARQFEFEMVRDALIAVDCDGIIASVTNLTNQKHITTPGLEKEVQLARKSGRYFEIGSDRGKFLIPGFIDTHIHAPQYSYTGLGLDKPLLQWLDNYTFPVEESFADSEVARDRFNNVVKASKKEGTTTAVYFATIHPEASILLAEAMQNLNQRGFVGPVSMDINPGVPSYGNSSEKSIKDAESCLKVIEKEFPDTIHGILTPRYLPTCSIELLNGLGELAAKYGCHIQSHIAESLDVLEHIQQMYPGKRDVQIFDEAGLLTRKTILAHGVHLTDEECQILKERGSSVSHCPLSNFYFAHGHFDVRRAKTLGLGVGLGTDVAGGYSISMLNAIRTSILAHKAIMISNKERLETSGEDPENSVTHKTGFYLATLGGAHALDIHNEVGSFEVGKKFDAIHIDLTRGNNIDLFQGLKSVDNNELTDQEDFERFILLGDSRNIANVYVNGV